MSVGGSREGHLSAIPALPPHQGRQEGRGRYVGRSGECCCHHGRRHRATGYIVNVTSVCEGYTHTMYISIFYYLLTSVSVGYFYPYRYEGINYDNSQMMLLYTHMTFYNLTYTFLELYYFYYTMPIKL